MTSDLPDYVVMALFLVPTLLLEGCGPDKDVQTAIAGQVKIRLQLIPILPRFSFFASSSAWHHFLKFLRIIFSAPYFFSTDAYKVSFTRDTY